MTDGLTRPGPPRLLPGLCPGGIVLAIYAVPSQRLLLTRNLDADNAESAGPLDAEDAFGRLLPGEDAVCLVAYDGDSGERGTFGFMPGRIEDRP